jgi:hypothetical protein
MISKRQYEEAARLARGWGGRLSAEIAKVLDVLGIKPGDDEARFVVESGHVEDGHGFHRGTIPKGDIFTYQIYDPEDGVTYVLVNLNKYFTDAQIRKCAWSCAINFLRNRDVDPDVLDDWADRLTDHVSELDG